MIQSTPSQAIRMREDFLPMGIAEEDTVRVGDVVLGLIRHVTRNQLVSALLVDLVVSGIKVEQNGWAP